MLNAAAPHTIPAVQSIATGPQPNNSTTTLPAPSTSQTGLTPTPTLPAVSGENRAEWNETDYENMNTVSGLLFWVPREQRPALTGYLVFRTLEWQIENPVVDAPQPFGFVPPFFPDAEMELGSDGSDHKFQDEL